MFQAVYGLEGGDPDATMLEVECCCQGGVVPAGTHCTVAMYVSFRHLNEDYNNTTLCPKCYPYPMAMSPDSFRRSHPYRCTREVCSQTIQDLIDSTLGDMIEFLGSPVTPRPPIQASRPATHSWDRCTSNSIQLPPASWKCTWGRWHRPGYSTIRRSDAATSHGQETPLRHRPDPERRRGTNSK